MSERPNRNCETCGSPVPACYALCFVCLADALNARLTELQDRVDNGFQGGCWCCESVATKNIELNAALERYKAWAEIEIANDRDDLDSLRKKYRELDAALERVREEITEWERRATNNEAGGYAYCAGLIRLALKEGSDAVGKPRI